MKVENKLTTPVYGLRPGSRIEVERDNTETTGAIQFDKEEKRERSPHQQKEEESDNTTSRHLAEKNARGESAADGLDIVA